MDNSSATTCDTMQIVVGKGVSPHKPIIIPLPTTTHHMGELWHKFATSCGTNIGYIAHKEPQKLCLFLLCLSVKTNFRHIENFTEDFVYSITILCCEFVMGAK